MKISIEVITAKFIEAGINTDVAIEHLNKLVQESLDDEGYLLPFWLKYPQIPVDSIGWRMGSGEDYMFLNQLYFQCLSNEQKVYYQKKYRKPRPTKKEERI